jgi:hypothetical protein
MMYPNGNLLLVEGVDDCYAIAELMGKHVRWGERSEDRPVYIQACNGGELDKDFISLKLREDKLRCLGIVIDADNSLQGRWNMVRTPCLKYFPGIAEAVVEGGLIVSNEEGKRLGIWIMPDNKSSGMIETFFGFLVPDGQEPLWVRAQEAAKTAKSNGAPFKDCHLDKANIHTWLSWQDPPGQSMGRALVKNMLNPHAEYALPFVTWFMNLYGLEKL